MFLDAAGNRRELTPTRAWWLRVPAVLLSPRSVFFALRDDDEDDVAARGEPILLITLLAGMAAVLATPTAADLLDNPEYDALLLAVWTFIAGAIYGATGYFVIGFVVFFGCGSWEAPATSGARDRSVGFAARASGCLGPPDAAAPPGALRR